MLSTSIAVIIPTYNRRYCIARALDSVLAQTHQPNEIIVVNDGSTDDTAEFISNHYPQVTLLTQQHAGVSVARNQGIRHATADWIALLDSDDAWHPTKLVKQIQALIADPHRLCHTEEIWYRDNKRVNRKNDYQKRGGWIFQHCLPRCAISPSSVLIARDLLIEVGLFDENLPACEDYDLWLRICAREPVLLVAEALTIKYGGHEDQLSRAWGLDRYRITALKKIIDDSALSVDDKQAALDMLQQKIIVYCQGAKKRSKHSEVEYYDALLQRYS